MNARHVHEAEKSALFTSVRNEADRVESVQLSGFVCLDSQMLRASFSARAALEARQAHVSRVRSSYRAGH
jgi:hypothetical protein